MLGVFTNVARNVFVSICFSLKHKEKSTMQNSVEYVSCLRVTKSIGKLFRSMKQ